MPAKTLDAIYKAVHEEQASKSPEQVRDELEYLQMPVLPECVEELEDVYSA